MGLYQSLQQARTEEDVKDAYIKALKLKTYTKNLIDVQTNEIWFEAKEKPTTPVAMFSQLLSYVRVAHKSGEAIHLAGDRSGEAVDKINTVTKEINAVVKTRNKVAKDIAIISAVLDFFATVVTGKIPDIITKGISLTKTLSDVPKTPAT